MIAGAFDDGDGARVAHGEAFAGDAAEIAFAADGAVEHRVADDDAFFRNDTAFLRRADHDASTGQTFADIVIRFANEIERNTGGKPRTEALACRSVEAYVNRILRQPLVPVAFGNLTREHGACRAVCVPDFMFEPHRLALFERRLGFLDQFAIENVMDVMNLPLAIVDGHIVRHLGLVEQAREIEALRFPVVDGRLLVEPVCMTDELVERLEAHLRHDLPHFFGDEEEIVDDVLGHAGESLAQYTVLRGNANGACIQMTFAHHQTAGSDQRCGGEAEFIGTQQPAHDDVAAGAHAAVDLHRDAAAQPVLDQRLVGLGQADFPGTARMLDGGEGARARPALEA